MLDHISVAPEQAQLELALESLTTADIDLKAVVYLLALIKRHPYIKTNGGEAGVVAQTQTGTPEQLRI